MRDEIDLMHLVYVSEAISDLSKQDLSEILLSAKRNNYRYNITGILVFSKGKFMQFLEGPEFNVMKTFKAIKNDFRHYGIDIVRQGNISRRQYEGWHMRFTDTEEILDNAGIIFEKLYSAKDMTEEDNDLATESSSWLLAFKEAN